jgi:hypothetical protein
MMKTAPDTPTARFDAEQVEGPAVGMKNAQRCCVVRRSNLQHKRWEATTKLAPYDFDRLVLPSCRPR